MVHEAIFFGEELGPSLATPAAARSFSFIFRSLVFHFLSFSFIFFHFLSFSLSLFCAQNLIFFLGLKFVTISLDSSYVKNQFWGPSRGVIKTPLGPLFLFFLLFFLQLFLSFFLLFIFIFLIFVHFFIFVFSCFHFFIFLKKKVSSFSFSCIFFQICFVAGISISV